MTARRLLAIIFIFLVSSLAWLTLGLSIVQRTGRSNAAMSQEVISLWGGEHRQKAPAALYHRPRTVEETVVEKDELGRETTRVVQTEILDAIPLALDSSRVDAALFLEHRRKGLLWHDTYAVDFRGEYRLVAPSDLEGPVEFLFSFPSQQGIYDQFFFRVNGREAPPVADLTHDLRTEVLLAAGEEAVVEVGYRSRGLDKWYYQFGPAGVTSVRNFSMTLETDFDGIDFPADTISPSEKRRSPQGWQLDWHFDHLISAKSVGLDLPNRLNPGPLAARITFFAPVSLLFFLTILVMLGVLKHMTLHPMHYFFLSAAFFSFHLLLAYLADHLDIHAAFALSAVVSVALVVSYLRLVCGIRQALLYAGGAQVVWLIVFSYAFFYQGYTGLTVTVGAIATLFLLMQLTARVDWDLVFARRSAQPLPGAADAPL